MRVAVLVGGTGLVGRSLLDLLTEIERYEAIICLNRRPLIDEHPKIKHREVDFDKLLNLELQLPKDSLIDAFCCLGTTKKKTPNRQDFARIDRDYVRSFALLMKEQKAQHLSVVSSLGASLWSPSFYAKTKALMEQDLQNIGLASVSIVRPSLLLGSRSEERPLEDWAKPITTMLVGPLRSFQGIDSFDVAKAMLALAENRQLGFHIYSSETLKQLAKAY